VIRSRAVALVTGLVAAVLLTGCSGEEAGNPTPAPTSTAGTSSVPSPSTGTLPSGTPQSESSSPSSGVPAPSSGLPIPVPSSPED
jgi:PBP1b-binding outer membrane lipoprotein LpoB